MPSKPAAKAFSAVLTKSNNLNWIVIRIPFDTVRIWGVRGSLRVKGDINGFPFQSSLFPTGDGHHFMVVNKQMQKGGRVSAGMEARFRMEPDTEKRVMPVVPEMDRVLKQSRRLRRYYDSLPPSMKSEIVRSISGAKHPETRRRRAEQLAVRLMETMEAEIELPPILRQFMVRNPQAEAGWRRMPPSHRRNQLLAIFYYRNPEARLRRIEKVIAEMIKYAR
jgi:uncharacterized protein YdeI (YjbR/CyaY-like superfamily)